MLPVGLLLPGSHDDDEAVKTQRQENLGCPNVSLQPRQAQREPAATGLVEADHRLT
jgi:hypothetical protein